MIGLVMNGLSLATRAAGAGRAVLSGGNALRGIVAAKHICNASKTLTAVRSAKNITSMLNVAKSAKALSMATKATNAVMTATKTADTMKKLVDASSLVSAGYMMGQYMEQRNQEKAQEEAARMADEQQKAQEEMALEMLRKENPTATDAELRELLELIIRMQH